MISLKKLADAQIFLIRDIFVNSVGLFCSLFLDILRNLMHAVGLNDAFTPVHFGIFQLFGTIFFGLFLVMSVAEFWLYYKPKEWE